MMNFPISLMLVAKLKVVYYIKCMSWDASTMGFIRIWKILLMKNSSKSHFGYGKVFSIPSSHPTVLCSKGKDRQ
ncbi:hypothetical protein QQP08_025612, partial [Theobroma cacao]